MKIQVLGLAALLFLASCASPPMSVIMTNPETGRSVYISHYSYGWGLKGIAAAQVAAEQQRKAIEAARLLGYTEMREVK